MDKKQQQRLMFNNIVTSMLLLDNYDEFKETPVYSREVKYHGNRFIEALRKRIEEIEINLHKSENDVKIVHQIMELYEEILTHLATANYETLLELICFIRDQKAGKVLNLNEEQIKKLKENGEI